MTLGRNNKQLLLKQLFWITISFGISLTVSMLLPFLLSLAVSLVVFIVLNMCITRFILRRIGYMEAGKMFDYRFDHTRNSSSLKYYCMSCNTEHRQIACPTCGSKMKRIAPN